MSRPARRFLGGVALVVVAGVAIVMAVRAGMAMGGEEVPRPATRALSGTWQRTVEAPRSAPPQAHAWSRLAEVASFAINTPGPGQVTVRMQDGTTVIGQVRQAAGGTMIIAIQDGTAVLTAVTIGQLGERGAVVMASGSSVITFRPGDGG